MAIISLRMPGELASKLNVAARRRGICRSALLRDALESYLSQAKVGSAADLLDDLIGAFEGPEDLSHHPEHMEGFG